MKKFMFSSLLFTMLLTSCTESAEEEMPGEALTELANSKETTDAVTAIIKKAGFSSIDEVEFFEIKSGFSFSTIEGQEPSVLFSLTLVTKEDNNKLMNYSYDFEKLEPSEGQYVTLTSGSGSSRVIAANYDDFKTSLFTTNDIPPFSKMDDMKKAAMENSGYEKDDQYTTNYSSGFSNLGRFKTSITVTNKKVRTMTKNFDFDKTGAIIE